MTPKVLIIGLDGATWDLMKPLTEKGKLPTLRKLIDEGVHGDLESTITPSTGLAWVSFATGKNPGKHGCYDFNIPKKSLSNIKTITTKDIQGSTFYEILSENGKKCIIINLPCSYPPRINGIVITSLMTQSDNCIFPRDLINEVPELKNYRIFPDVSLHERRKIIEYVNDIRELERNRFECAKILFKKDWDFFFILFSGTDWIQHDMFAELISGLWDDNSAPIKLYEEIDGYIGWFVDNAPQNTYIFLVSDHGFKAYKKAFYINAWLRKEGFLKVEQKSKRKTSSSKFEVESEKVASKLINIKVPVFLLKHLSWIAPFYYKFKKYLPINPKVEICPKLSDSVAYSIASTIRSNFGSIYINDKKRFIDGKVEIENYEKVREEIINKLKMLKDPKTWENVIKKVWKKEELYFGDNLEIGPDIFFMLSDEYQVRSGLFAPQIFNYKLVEYSSGHALYGIFLAYGPDIRKRIEIKNVRIYDIAPTILHVFGIAIPRDMDGRVLKEIFKEDSELLEKRIKYQEIKEEEKIKIKKKIKEIKVI